MATPSHMVNHRRRNQKFPGTEIQFHFIIRTVKAIFWPSISVHKQSQHDRELTEKNAKASLESSDIPRMPSRVWKSSEVPLLPFSQWVFLSRNVSKLLYCLQLLSATACVGLSLRKLIKHDYGEVEKGDTEKRNRKAALYISIPWHWQKRCCF
ncbi:hypothetical protein CJ030_MR5G027218 [Morella rubra]|uniref:Uncharacterized protein n=1 Tax=Morella rubra TaxID=262757 RepID=A0A6A1VQG5_9ROSI|nr:hypothetical protein CJ030_MR5G027218 [Morella rubra]